MHSAHKHKHTHTHTKACSLVYGTLTINSIFHISYSHTIAADVNERVCSVHACVCVYVRCCVNVCICVQTN